MEKDKNIDTQRREKKDASQTVHLSLPKFYVCHARLQQQFSTRKKFAYCYEILIVFICEQQSGQWVNVKPQTFHQKLHLENEPDVCSEMQRYTNVHLYA